MPNHVGATMYPSPQVIGVIAVVYGKVQLMTGAVSTGLVAWPYDGRSPLSMASAAGSLKVFRVEEVRSHPHCPVWVNLTDLTRPPAAPNDSRRTFTLVRCAPVRTIGRDRLTTPNVYPA